MIDNNIKLNYKRIKKLLNFKIALIISLILFSCNEEIVNNSNDLINTVKEHPNLILTKKGVEQIKTQLGNVPLFDKTLAKVKLEVDAEIASGIHVPIPKDLSGGYTHERHKLNYHILQKAGVLFQILDDEKYAIYIRDMLMEYAKMYPTLPLHPQERSYARGKIFWQCLNDSNWLVYVSQSYDCIYDWLDKEDRDYLENKLFKPFADFLSTGSPQFFNRVHNHSTWGNAAVGMIGLVMGDDELVNRALYGLKEDNIKEGAKDNDGGLIKEVGQKTGFLANIEAPFSPEGYYTEAPYYQRYAMYPFIIFAQGLYNVKPELKIFEYKDAVLLKAVYTLLNLTDLNGDFYPLNDAQKGMSYYSRELVSAVNIAYKVGGNDATLLSIIEKQNKVLLDDSGIAAAIAISEGETQPFVKKSMEITDGSDGTEGGIGIIRNSDSGTEMNLVMKYTAQGNSHGHYDKLSFLLYDNGDEVMQDYGMVRFVNIEQKGGGNYLKENNTWAKQTIAHNTIVQNEVSHFNGDFETGNKYSSEKYLFDVSDPNFQIVSAKENNAYPGTELHRTMAVIKNDNFENPFVIDIFKVQSKTNNQYDLPFFYLGQILGTNFEYETPKQLQTLGKSNGYQHLWQEAIGLNNKPNAKLTWFSNKRFYTLTTLTKEKDQLIFARLGANDPNFNLRKDPVFIIRKKDTKQTTFVSTIESHGNYNPVSEIAKNASSNISEINLIHDSVDYTAIKITDINNNDIILIISNLNNSKNQKHILNINEKQYKWEGPYYCK
ncbi:MAG: heparinase II/III family protein [Flavobacteriaceae bacterium]|nr:heparinase II/III family protein [Flavobacteriaceae bacterium]